MFNDLFIKIIFIIIDALVLILIWILFSYIAKKLHIKNLEKVNNSCHEILDKILKQSKKIVFIHLVVLFTLSSVVIFIIF